MELKGLGVSDGIGIGKAVVLENEEFDTSKSKKEYAQEVLRFQDAVDNLLKILREKADQASGEQAEILGSHIDMLNDPVLLSEIKKLMENESCNSEYATAAIFDQYIQVFLCSGDELLELRASDLKDIKNNILATLSGKELMDVSQLPSGTVLVAEELTTSIAAGIKPEIGRAHV